MDLQYRFVSNLRGVHFLVCVHTFRLWVHRCSATYFTYLSVVHYVCFFQINAVFFNNTVPEVPGGFAPLEDDEPDDEFGVLGGLDFAQGPGEEEQHVPQQQEPRNPPVTPYGGHNEAEAGPSRWRREHSPPGRRWTMRGGVLVEVDEDDHEFANGPYATDREDGH